MAPEFMTDAFDDLADASSELAAFYAESDALARAAARPVAPYVAPVPAGFVTLYLRQREALAMDIGFLLTCNAIAPECFADLVAWRLRGSLAHAHATGATQKIINQDDAARARRHREYKDGMRTRSLPEAM